MSKFAHLRTHSHYSLLEALPKIPDLVKKAKAAGMEALALTDSGNLYGAIEFYKECKENGIKPIIGVDFYVANRSRHDKENRIDTANSRLVLLAENLDGYKNLLKLVTYSYIEGFYYRPRIDRELLEKYNHGLIAIAKEEKYYREIFGDNFFLESSLAIYDVYYLEPEDRPVLETIRSIQEHLNRGNTFDDETDLSFRTQTQAKADFKNSPVALENTMKIAERCNLELELGQWVFPNLEMPDGLTPDEALRRVVLEGLEKRALEKTPEVLERVEYELKVVKDKGYSKYFLVVADLLRFAHENGILTNTRGSVTGSLVSYLSGITTVNPLEFDLPFERFLNPERPSQPDIDMDFADDRRDEMIEYAKRKYGADKVAQIGTFGTMMARGSVRDIARAMNLEYSIGDRIAKLIPFGSQGFPMSIDRALALVPELSTLYKEDASVKAIVDMAKNIEGCARHISVHAAGVVIAPTPLTDFVPLQLDPKGGKLITQYDMHAVEDAGLLKFDFLGIRNLSILAHSIKITQETAGVAVEIENVPLDDKITFDLLGRGETAELFQLAGGGMTRHLKDLKPTSIHDINAM